MDSTTAPALTNGARRPSEAVSDGVWQPRAGEVRDDLQQLVAQTGVRPIRARGEDARSALERDGAVILPGVGGGPDGLAVAAAEVLGERLRQLFPVRHRGAESEGFLDLHSDSFHIVHDIHGTLRAERDPDEDYLLMLLGRAPAQGGESIVVDGYRVIDRIAEHRPQLHSGLAGFDLDLIGAWSHLPGLPSATRVCRLVEHTRTGRRIVKLGGGIRPLLRDHRFDEVAGMLDEYRDVAATAAAAAPRFSLDTGDVLMLDNYRCWHGREPFTGPRQLYVQTVRSQDAF